MNNTIKYTIFMIVIGVVVSLLLSIVNEFTSPIIENQKLEKVKISLEEVDNVNKWQSYSNVINISEDEFIEEVYVSINNNKEYQKMIEKRKKEREKTNKKRARKGMPPDEEKIHMDASIEYIKQGGYYLLKYERGTIRAWAAIKSY